MIAVGLMDARKGTGFGRVRRRAKHATMGGRLPPRGRSTSIPVDRLDGQEAGLLYRRLGGETIRLTITPTEADRARKTGHGPAGTSGADLRTRTMAALGRVTADVAAEMRRAGGCTCATTTPSRPPWPAPACRCRGDELRPDPAPPPGERSRGPLWAAHKAGKRKGADSKPRRKHGHPARAAAGTRDQLPTRSRGLRPNRETVSPATMAKPRRVGCRTRAQARPNGAIAAGRHENYGRRPTRSSGSQTLSSAEKPHGRDAGERGDEIT